MPLYIKTYRCRAIFTRLPKRGVRLGKEGLLDVPTSKTHKLGVREKAIHKS